MPTKLTLNPDKKRWYPNSVTGLEGHLVLLINANKYFSKSESIGIRKNIAYSLQYIEFLDRVMKDINLSTVIYTQNVKSFVVHGAAIIEAICNFVVISNGFGKKTLWKSVAKSSSNEYDINSVTYKNETEIFEKLKEPTFEQMTFDQLTKKIETKKLFGKTFSIYSKIKPLRQLRNKIHIHDAKHSDDTDWYNFSVGEYALVREVLLKVLTSELFDKSTYCKSFDYLKDS